MGFPGAINLYSKIAVYEQLEILVETAIASGELKEGQKLPSVRELSELYRVNPNTIAKAYRDLEVLGAVRARRGEGVFVAEKAQERCSKRCLKRALTRVYVSAQEARAAGIPQSKLSDAMRKAYNMPDNPFRDLPEQILHAARE